jgi:pimeloyl-ACP methyl ester carboxylesterase
LLEAGKIEGPAVMLLHGSCSNSAFWFAEMMALSQKYHVYAADIIGEAGNSDENRLDTSSSAYAFWIKELMDALSIQRAVVIGNSLGGWMALNFATEFPERTNAVVLIAASGITPPRPSFLHQTESISQGGEGEKSLSSSVIGESAIPREVTDFINLILENFNPMAGALPIYKDDQLRRLHIPVLSIMGEDDVTVDANMTAQRLSELVPGADVRIIKNCGHVVLNSADTIMQFLSKEAIQ